MMFDDNKYHDISLTMCSIGSYQEIIEHDKASTLLKIFYIVLFVLRSYANGLDVYDNFSFQNIIS